MYFAVLVVIIHFCVRSTFLSFTENADERRNKNGRGQLWVPHEVVSTRIPRLAFAIDVRRTQLHLTCGIFWFLRAKRKQTNKLYENFGLAKQCFFTLGAKNVLTFLQKKIITRITSGLLHFKKPSAHFLLSLWKVQFTPFIANTVGTSCWCPH